MNEIREARGAGETIIETDYFFRTEPKPAERVKQ